MPPKLTPSLQLVVGLDFVSKCIHLAREHSQGSTSSTDTDFSQLSLNNDSGSNSSCSSYSTSTPEAMFYYSGLVLSPKLVYHTSANTTPWTMPTEHKADLKELRPVFGHKLNAIWATELGPKTCQILDLQGVRWTSIDIVRFRMGGVIQKIGSWVMSSTPRLSHSMLALGGLLRIELWWSFIRTNSRMPSREIQLI